jgi:hypothetical protein
MFLIETPLSNVNVVIPPVGNNAACVVVPPTPNPFDPMRRKRSKRSLPLIEVPVDFFRNLFGRIGSPFCREKGHRYIHGSQFAEPTISDQFDRRLKPTIATLLRAGLEDSFRFRNSFAKEFSFVNGQRERFFAVNILTGTESLDVDFRVPVIWGTLNHDIDIFIVDDFSVILYDHGFFRFDSILESLGVTEIGITDHNDLTVSSGESRNAAASTADTDAGDSEFVRGTLCFCGRW